MIVYCTTSGGNRVQNRPNPGKKIPGKRSPGKKYPENLRTNCIVILWLDKLLMLFKAARIFKSEDCSLDHFWFKIMFVRLLNTKKTVRREGKRPFYPLVVHVEMTIFFIRFELFLKWNVIFQTNQTEFFYGPFFRGSSFRGLL